MRVWARNKAVAMTTHPHVTLWMIVIPYPDAGVILLLVVVPGMFNALLLVYSSH